ncbi:MAG: hypothetical protein NTZ26_03070 [Candidatus Aminicenantes bacterium]|nr:hypothetical protein [Candidatus Aminicenantes bacterium]
MGKYAFDKIMTGEEIKDIIQKELGPAFRMKVKPKRIEIIQDATKGCAVQVRERDGRTICRGPYGYMPSDGLRAAIIIGGFAAMFILGLSLGYFVVGIGVLPMAVLLLLMNAPSRPLVKRVAGILGKVASQS